MLTDVTNFAEHEEAPAEHTAQKKKACFVGVRHHGECRTNPWEARCRAGGRKHNLGYFASAVEAARAYDAFARQFGRKLNFPDDHQPSDKVTYGAAHSYAVPTTGKRTLDRCDGGALEEPPTAHAGSKLLAELQVPLPDSEAVDRRCASHEDDGEVTPTEGNDGAKRVKLLRAHPRLDDSAARSDPATGSAHDDPLGLRRPGRRVLDFPSPAHAHAASPSPAFRYQLARGGMTQQAHVSAQQQERGLQSMPAQLLAQSAPWRLPWGGYSIVHNAHASCGMPSTGLTLGHGTMQHVKGRPSDEGDATAANAEAMHAASSLLFLSGLVA